MIVELPDSEMNGKYSLGPAMSGYSSLAVNIKKARAALMSKRKKHVRLTTDFDA